MIRHRLLGLVSALALAAACGSAHAQVGTAITYQGQLKNAGSPVNTPTDMRFSLWTDPAAGTQLGSTVESLAVPVSQGLFNASMDFGIDPYDSDQAAYLQIEVRNPAGVGAYVPMGSRQRLTAAPYSAATRGINVNENGRVGILTQPFDDSAALTLGSTGGGTNLRYRGANERFWDTVALDGVGPLFGDFFISRSGLDIPFTIDGETGNVGIGADSPAERLTVNGTVHSLSGGIKFPDDSSQSTAPIGQRDQDEVLMLGPGSFVGVSGNAVHNDWFWGVYTTGNSNEMVAPVHLPAGAEVVSVTAYVYDNSGENLRVELLQKINNDTSSFTTAYGFEVQAGFAGFTNQTQTGSHIIEGTRAHFLWVGTVNGTWDGTNLAIQNVKIVWRMP